MEGPSQDLGTEGVRVRAPQGQEASSHLLHLPSSAGGPFLHFVFSISKMTTVGMAESRIPSNSQIQ